MNGGAKYPGLAPENKEKLFAFETHLINLQFAAEDSFNGSIFKFKNNVQELESL